MNKNLSTYFPSCFTIFFLLIIAIFFYTHLGSRQAPVNINNKKTELMISAAISLKDIINELGQEFEKIYPATKILFNFAATGQLRAQIASGAPVDIFIPAAIADMQYLEKKNLLLKNSQKILAKNQLALIVHNSNNNIKSLEDLKNPLVKKIAIGNPESVAGGRYAQETLEHFKILSAIKNKLIFTENIRQALHYVVKNEVDAGLVFFTDAKTNPNVKIIIVIPKEAHQPIIYPIAILQSSNNIDLAKKFIELATTANGMKILEKHGFLSK